jgi:hypothetical protein
MNVRMDIMVQKLILVPHVLKVVRPAILVAARLVFKALWLITLPRPAPAAKYCLLKTVVDMDVVQPRIKDARSVIMDF